ncbi:NADH:ubiquinone reductase (Na(+)-transporting) subunit B [Persicitalea jodogahamensis]|uniref:Na(+)-translocating NADH-quinone reductase subunit B n=1 Tax=Persicitalea jodogahamensis TaxID=402147 RepID=A0A8J3D721_9BACT|nr:NADH:ubiquinone reductase (Na(+)-transporting) subunit B [Persicitalea jodogahamensis]GHB70370.1 Na(+)-translocating NADH-quinone reductase subunit B [Persicitalea jodogahamensis]
MKPIRNLVESLEPHFKEGGKYEKFHPAFDALSTFLFVPGHTTENGVHIRDAMDLKRTMFTVVIAMIPTLLFGMWNVGYQHYLAYGMDMSLMENFMFGFWRVMPIVVVSYAVGLGTEFVFAISKKHVVSEGYLVTGLLIPLILPVTIPLWMVAFASIFCVIIGKEIFGGTGMNFMNPALLARAFLFFAFPAYMTGDIWTDLTPEPGHALVDAYTGATNLVTFDNDFTQLPSPSDMFWGFEQGSIGETSVFAILIGVFILIASGVGSWKIILSCVIGTLAMGLFLNLLAPVDVPTSSLHTPAYYHLLMGSFAFGAAYMATDPVSAAHTEAGKWIYGILIGVFTVILRVFNPAYPEGVMLAILLMNVFAPLIDHLVVERHIQTRMKRA